MSKMRRTPGNGKSREVDSVDEVADERALSPFFEENLEENLDDFMEELALALACAQVAEGSEGLENGQVAEGSGKGLEKALIIDKKCWEKREQHNGARKERCVEEKGDAEDDDKADGFYEEALDDFCSAGSRDDATITWDNLHKAQRHRIVDFCEDRGLVATEWPHTRAARGKVVVSWARKKRADVAGKSRKR